MQLVGIFISCLPVAWHLPAMSVHLQLCAWAFCRYQSVLDALPPVLCLAESRIYHLVEALTQELKVGFKESGLSCPPWRDAHTVLDKWLAKKPQDVHVDPEASLQQLQQSLAGSLC